MDEAVAAEFDRWVNRATASRDAAPVPPVPPARGAGAPGAAARGGVAPGELTDPVRLDREGAARLVVVAARIAAGFFRPTRRTTVVWVDGDSELAVEYAAVRIALGAGRLDLTLPVRCDQTGPAEVVVTFAVGRPDAPAGVYAATARRPTGPRLVVDAWGEALVAFAWDVVLTLVAQLAGARGKDARGNLLVPAELAVTDDALTVAPMGRFRFAGASGLRGAP